MKRVSVDITNTSCVFLVCRAAAVMVFWNRIGSDKDGVIIINLHPILYFQLWELSGLTGFYLSSSLCMRAAYSL